MRSANFNIVAVCLVILQVAAAVVQTQMVWCQGANGHLALEVAHGDEKCGHGCEPVEDHPAECDDEHSCLDTAVQDDAQRPVDDGSGTLPPARLAAWLNAADLAAVQAEQAVRSLPGLSRSANPSAGAVRTFILRL